MVKEKITDNKKEAEDDKRYLQNMMKLNHKNILQMIDYSIQSKKESLSTRYISRAFYKYPNYVLSYKSTKMKKQEKFLEKELKDLFQDCKSALLYLHEKKQCHRDIRPQLIGWDKKTKNYFVILRLKDPFLTVEEIQINNLNKKKDVYMSPQLYQKIKSQNKNQVFNPYQNDLIALGMTILHLGIKDSVQDCYNEVEDFQKKLYGHVEKFKCRYLKTDLINNIKQSLQLNVVVNKPKQISFLQDQVLFQPHQYQQMPVVILRQNPGNLSPKLKSNYHQQIHQLQYQTVELEESNIGFTQYRRRLIVPIPELKTQLTSLKLPYGDLIFNQCKKNDLRRRSIKRIRVTQVERAKKKPYQTVQNQFNQQQQNSDINKININMGASNDPTSQSKLPNHQDHKSTKSEKKKKMITKYVNVKKDGKYIKIKKKFLKQEDGTLSEKQFQYDINDDELSRKSF